MPVINEPNKVIKNSNGSLVDFTFNFKFFEDEDLVIKTITPEGIETLKELDTDYTISSTDKNSGGTVTFVTAPATGTVLIKRELPLEQGANFRPVSGFPEQVITDALDRGMMVDQDLQEQINRSLVLPAGSSVTGLALPVPDAGKTLKWNVTEDALENSDTSIDDIQSSLDEAAASAAQSAASAAIAQAASGSIPAPVAANYLRQNAAASGFEYRTPSQAFTDINFDDCLSWVKQFIQFNDRKKIRIKKGTFIALQNAAIDVRYYKVDADVDVDVTTLLDTGSTLTAGKDYYVYLVPSGSTVALKVSLNSTYPTGYAANNTRKIGGFHTECVNVGTISGHTLSTWLAGDILPASVWCLLHRPVASPEGMVYIDMLDCWVDIYLQSGQDLTTASAFGATVKDTRPWSDHCEDLFKVGKTLLSDSEFAIAMEGSNQKTAIFGSASPTPKTSGGHLDTASRRMVSNYGIEEGCGFLYQWLDHPSANGGTGYTNHDAIAGAKGQLYGASYAMLAGGDWDRGASCGSRFRNANSGRATAYASVGGRGRSWPKKGL